MLVVIVGAQIHAGLDETADVGMGRSKHACEENGMESVYLDYLYQVCGPFLRKQYAALCIPPSPLGYTRVRS